MEILDLRSADGTKINAHRWSPAGAPKAEVLLCHGLAEHMGRYDHVAKALTDAGYRVTGIELRGHGHSGGKRGHIDRFDDYLADFRAGSAAIGQDHFVLAHSMGTLVTLELLRQTPETIKGVVLSGLALGIAVQAPRWKITAGKVLSRLLPSLAMFNEVDPSDICSDPAVTKEYVDDPLVFDTITPRWYTEFVAAQERVHAYAGRYHTPMLAMWGTEDRLVSISDIERFLPLYGGDLETKSWDGLYHEIFNEPQHEEVFNTFLQWLDKHCDQSTETA
jgi:alpha-beta hydrolase superfamily lysophospholipase